MARPSRTGLKFTDPAVTMSESGSERQPITLFSTSLMISASHSTPKSAGPRAIQCDRPLPSSVTCSRWAKTRAQVLELAPERVDLGDRLLEAHGFTHVNAAVAQRRASVAVLEWPFANQTSVGERCRGDCCEGDTGAFYG